MDAEERCVCGRVRVYQTSVGDHLWQVEKKNTIKNWSDGDVRDNSKCTVRLDVRKCKTDMRERMEVQETGERSTAADEIRKHWVERMDVDVASVYGRPGEWLSAWWLEEGSDCSAVEKGKTQGWRLYELQMD